MRIRAPLARVAALSAAIACGLAYVGGAAAAGPVFAVVANDSADRAAPVPSAPPALDAPAPVLSAFMRFTATDPVAAAALRQETLGAQAVSIALRFIGVPYVWGGASPSGFDCSGLTMYVYGLLGVQLSHWTGHQWNEGTQVAWDQMQPGDLIFFDLGNGVPQHEGMYVGRGLMVQAPRRGDIVRVVPLSANRYAERFVRAVRPY